MGQLAEERAGLSLGRVDDQEVRRRASRRLGRAVVGDDPGLRVLLADAAKASLTPLGRVWLRNELVRRSLTEARLEDEFRRQPRLMGAPVPLPLIVLGLPRTGTTLLRMLLGCDPAAFVLPFWQLRRPYPIPRGRLERAGRILRAAAMARLAQVMAPRLRDIHPVPVLRPEEDVFLFRDTGMLAVPVAAPGYLRWLQKIDPTPGYRTYRRHLQVLSHHRRGRRPVLKSPFHLGRLEAVDLVALGRRWLDFWASEMDAALASRAAADPARFHDVVYEALVADPLAEVERLYGRLGLELSGAARRRMTRWIHRHHHRRRGRASPHRYSLADFELDAAVIDGRFAHYREWMAAST